MAWYLPFTNDEGAYLYDALTLSQGRLPGGDVIVKTPGLMLLAVPAVWLSSGSIWAIRGLTVLAGLFTAWPLFIIGRQLMNKTAGRSMALVWLLGMAPIPYHVFGQTQTLAALFMASGLATILVARDTQSKISWRPTFGVILLVLAVATRKTSVVAFIPAVWWYFLAGKSGSGTRQQFSFAGLTAIVLLISWLLVSFFLYGMSGLWEASGSGYLSIIFQNLTQNISGWGGGFKQNVVAYWQVASACLLIALLGLIWLLTAIKSDSAKEKKLAFGLASWLLLLVFLYAGWPVLLPEYLLDFALPLTMAVGLAIGSMKLAVRNMPVILSTSLIFITLLAMNWHSAVTKPVTGMFNSAAVFEMAELLQNKVPEDETIFTAAVIVPYLLDRQVAFGIAHPLWYSFDFISKEARDAFLPPPNEIAQALENDQINWLLDEDLTQYAYRSVSELDPLTYGKWEQVGVVENNTGYRSNPLTLWHRLSPL